MPSLRLQVLGPARIKHADAADRSASLLSQPRRIALLVYLVLARPRGFHSRDTLAALFWPESDQKQARHALRNSLHAIRRAVGDEVIVTEGASLVGVDNSLIDCDVLELEDHLSGNFVLEHLPGNEGVLLRGFNISAAPGFDDWVAAERHRLDEMVLGALRKISQTAQQAGDAEGALEAARRANEMSPYDERSLRRLMELLDQSGDAATALQVYDEFAARMERELGALPSSPTAQMVAAVRSRQQHTARANLPQPHGNLPTADGEAYIQYVRGTYLFLRAAHSGNQLDLEQSRHLLEEALRRDCNFALAHAGMSNYYAVAAVRDIIRPFSEAFAQVLKFSHSALALDSQLSIPHVHFGVKAMYLDDDWERAGSEFALAARLDPSYAEARRFRGIWLEVMGRTDEALAEYRSAVQLEPYMPIYRNALAAALMQLREWQAAMAELKFALGVDPGYGAARERFVRCAEELHLFGQAVSERERPPSMRRAGEFSAACKASGRDGYCSVLREELRDQIRLLTVRAQRKPPVNPSDTMNPPELQIATLHARLGEVNEAREWEERACSERPGLRPWFRSRTELRRSQN